MGIHLECPQRLGLPLPTVVVEIDTLRHFTKDGVVVLGRRSDIEATGSEHGSSITAQGYPASNGHRTDITAAALTEVGLCAHLSRECWLNLIDRHSS